MQAFVSSSILPHSSSQSVSLTHRACICALPSFRHQRDSIVPFNQKRVGQKKTQFVNTIKAQSSTADVVEQIHKDIEKKSPAQIIKYALEKYGDEIAISFSGAEDVILIEYAKRSKLPFRVFTLDTGRLHPETYQLLEQVQKHYGIKIEVCFPDKQKVEDLVNAKGLFSFYEDGHRECCGIRKVHPLRQKLSTLKAWITGQRKDQSPSTRVSVALVENDPSFQGSVPNEKLIKFNPLANTSSDDVWFVIRGNNVPYNKLHMEGYKSIGCEPCTRPILPSQHEREGRWWWEEDTHKECGLHSGNLSEAIKTEFAL